MINLPPKINLGGELGMKETKGGTLEFEVKDATRWAKMKEVVSVINLDDEEPKETEVEETEVDSVDLTVFSKKELLALAKERGVDEKDYKYANKSDLIKLLS